MFLLKSAINTDFQSTFTWCHIQTLFENWLFLLQNRSSV